MRHTSTSHKESPVLSIDIGGDCGKRPVMDGNQVKEDVYGM